MAKRRRRKPRWGRILWPLVIISSVSGWFFSSATALTSVRVEGAKPVDEARIRGILETGRYTPFPKLNGSNFESLVMDIPGVDTARLSRTPFGRGTMVVSYTRPVARVNNGKTFLMGENGTFFTDRGEENLPEVRVNPQLEFGASGLANQFDSPTVMKLVAELGDRFASNRYRVEVPVINQFLAVVDNCVIEFGDSTQLDEKFRLLDGLIRENSNLIASSKRVVLTQIRNPVNSPAVSSDAHPKNGPNSGANDSQNPPN